jgi:hypothetical protein
MEDQIITFETAKLAKEKGFDERFFKAYMNNTLCCEFIDKGAYRNSDLNTEWIKEHYKHKYSAPTQSLLQKWLREKHKIVVSPDIYNTEKFKIYWAVGIVFIETLEQECFAEESKANFQLGDMFKSYEEALEKGLYEALKLI